MNTDKNVRETKSSSEKITVSRIYSMLLKMNEEIKNLNLQLRVIRGLIEGDDNG